ncbi:LINE-1 type transposase domain-containing 1 [Scomber scombrus]|uniref:LINE-1 type transposase domain-containing 1 n=1 Tax=Scomber scombrus TaxID=13677 RepID=A0AAV1QFC8_SCOSC
MAAANVANDASPDLNVEDIIAQVLEKQQSLLESVVHNAVKGALTEIDTSLQHIRTELEMQGTTVRDVMQRLEKTQGDNRQMKKIVNACVDDQKKFEHKLAEMEDRSRRNNVRIIGLTEGSEKSDPVGFLQEQLPVWIHSLQNKEPTAEPEQADPPTAD